MKHFVKVFAAIALASGAAPAFAADAGVVAPRPAAPAAAPAIRNVLSLEFGPEFAEATRNLADVYGKASLAHTFANGWIWTGTFQDTFKANAANEQQQLIETTLGYNFKLDPTFTLTTSAGVGYEFDSNPANKPAQNYGYYVLNAGLNVKLSSQWTWNAIAARYRDAFSGGWATPKVSTGLTYTIDAKDSVYANIGYSWKNGVADKIGIAVGYKYGF
jgi:hypothetical protein